MEEKKKNVLQVVWQEKSQKKFTLPYIKIMNQRFQTYCIGLHFFVFGFDSSYAQVNSVPLAEKIP